MEIHGRKAIQAAPNICYRLLIDPDVLVEAMPGLKSMEAVGAGRHRAEIDIGVPGLRGHYTGVMSLQDAVENQSFRLKMEGEGPSGTLFIELAVRFEETATGSDVFYDGEAHFEGSIAGAGQRLLSGAVSLLMNQFFGRIAKKARRTS